MEIGVGITEFLSLHQGIRGIIKQRYSDFMVNEIDTNDQIVKLTTVHYEEIKIKDTNSIEDTSHVLTKEQMEKIKQVEDKQVLDCKLDVNNDKVERRKIHEFIKKNYPSLTSTTLEIEGSKHILVSRNHAKRYVNSGIMYCKFVLYKENKSTMEAIEYISKLLRVKHNMFSYAGTKDKRAITSQEVTVYKIHPKRLEDLNKVLKNVTLGNFRCCDSPLKLGDLNGNFFQIILRNVKNSDEEINYSLNLLRKIGFINYFGMQRFGTTEVCNSEIGRCILKSDWSSAIENVLKPRQEANDFLVSCRKIWVESRDPSKALNALKNYSCVERKLLEGLEKYSARNYVAAFSMIPRNMRLMYLHSYQSLVWNKVVSLRIQNFGDKVLMGDIYQKDRNVCFVTEENIKDITITDIVHPLPGFDILYPSNIIKQWYSDILKADTVDELSFKHKIRDYSLSGSYRKIVIIPNICNWNTFNYDDYQVPLLQSDLDLLQNNKQTPSGSYSAYKGLKLELKLPASSYATMALRELLREDTSSLHQSSLNTK